MNLIVNVDLDWGIGQKGQLLVSLAADMQYFKRITTGKTIILGRKTLLTFPKGQPLPNRTNLILSKNQNFNLPGAVVCHSLVDLGRYIKEHPDQELIVVGGEHIYQQLLPYCQLAYVTKVQHSFAADRFFPNLDLAEGWTLLEEGPLQSASNRMDSQQRQVSFSFCVYRQEAAHDPAGLCQLAD